MSGIRVTPEQLAGLSSRVSSGSASIEGELRALSGSLAPLGSDWAGVAQQRFQALWAEWQKSAEGLREALGDKAGIRRFGDALVPLDETLCQVAVDLSGRPYLVHTEPDIVELIGSYETTLTKHVWESFVAEARICLHVRVLEGRNAHHVNEAQFKAVARALRDAVRLDGVAGIPSTKGVL